MPDAQRRLAGLETKGVLDTRNREEVERVLVHLSFGEERPGVERRVEVRDLTGHLGAQGYGIARLDHTMGGNHHRVILHPESGARRADGVRWGGRQLRLMGFQGQNHTQNRAGNQYPERQSDPIHQSQCSRPVWTQSRVRRGVTRCGLPGRGQTWVPTTAVTGRAGVRSTTGDFEVPGAMALDGFHQLA
jgi:hypothetical protein